MSEKTPKKKVGRPRKQSAGDSESEAGRSNNWTVVAYPESLPEGWEALIEEYHIQWACSPLHSFDKDPNSDDKKAHYHIALKFDTMKSFDQVRLITQKLNAPIPKRVMSMKGLVRYFCHLDNPDKHQYPLEEIRTFGGFDVDDIMKPTATEQYQIVMDILDYIEDKNICEIQQLVIAARRDDKEDWVRTLMYTSERFVNSYLRSKRHAMPKHQQEPIQHTDDDILAEIKAKLKKPEQGPVERGAMPRFFCTPIKKSGVDLLKMPHLRFF